MTCLGFLISSFCGGNPAAAEPVSQWQPLVLSFEAERDHDWHAFPLQASFSHVESGTTLNVDAYWDGERRWSLRFSPTLPGLWTYRTSSPDLSLDGHTGRIECRAPTSPEIAVNPNLRGKIQVVRGSRHFAYSDGTPFLGLAEQLWDFNVSTWLPLADLDVYLADREAKGFNIVQVRFSRLHMANEGGFAFPHNQGPEPGNGDFDKLNADYFRFLDRRMEKCFAAGFVVAGHPLWIGFDTAISVADAKKLQRYFLARYGAYPIIWSLSGEFDKAFHDQRGGKTKWRDRPHVKGVWNNGSRFDPETDCDPWRQLGRHAASHNAYGFPISIHPNVGLGDRRSSGDWLHDEEWLDHNWIQTYKAVHLVPGRVQRDYRRTPAKPVFFSEGIREGDQTDEIDVGAYGVRWEAWQSYLNGAAIHTYRHFGVYMDKWHAGGRCGPLRENLDAPGAGHSGLCAKLLRDPKWRDLVPARDRLRIDGEEAPFLRRSEASELSKSPALALSSDRGCLLYVPKISGNQKLTIEGLKAGPWETRWFNPRDGTILDRGISRADAGRPWIVPGRPDRMDWVLLLESATESP